MNLPGNPHQPDLPGGVDFPGDVDIPEVDPVNIDPLVWFSLVRADVPLLMLPVRLETRFYRDPNVLKIRIFPDQIHVNSHQEALGDREVELGQRFWELTWGANWEKTRRVFQRLADTLGAWRAIWVVESTTPTNLGDAEAKRPTFGVPVTGRSPEEPALLDLLPVRWVAVGITGRKTRFTEYGEVIPNALRFAPFQMHGDDDLDRWMVDFEAAKRVGMALEIALTGTKSSIINTGLDELIVLGVRVGDADALANKLEKTLEAHYYTRGFDFVPQGTPTNNTETVTSPWRWNDADAESVLAHLLQPQPAGDTDSRQRFSATLGLNEDGIAGRAVHGDTAEVPGMEAMNHALWYITWGEYLRNRLSDGETHPIPTTTLDWLRDWFVGHVRGGAVYPAFHVGSMPYGTLPVRLPPVPLDAHTKEEYLQWAISNMREGWERSLPNVPHLDPTATASADEAPETTDLEAANDNLIALLSSHPHPVRFFSRDLNNLRTWPWWSLVFDPVMLYNLQIDVMLPRMDAIDSAWHSTVERDLETLFPSLDYQLDYFNDLRAEAESRRDALQDELDAIGDTFGGIIPPNMVPTVEALVDDIEAYDAILGNIDEILKLLNSHAGRVYPVNSLGLPPLMDVLSEETPNPEHFYYVYDDEEVREWGDLPLVQAAGARDGASAAVYLDWLSDYARGTVWGAAPEGMSDPAPLLFQLIKASIDKANAWDNGALVSLDHFIRDIDLLSQVESKTRWLSEAERLMKDTAQVKGAADLLAGALQSPAKDETRAAIAQVPRETFRRASAQLRQYQQVSHKTSLEVNRVIGVFERWASEPEIDIDVKPPWGGTDHIPTMPAPRMTLLANAIGVLAGEPPETLEIRLKETLGLAMHRLDAWMTAYAEQRVDDLRRTTPTGIQLGGFGWVENLRPDEAGTAASQGFIHAPSMTQAATAAVLRSGYSAYSDGGATSPLSVDLRSDRVRVAAWMMDGVRQGQPINELLGYRFERYLHDNFLDFWIDPVRDVVAANGETEYAAARTTAIVDGLALLELWDEGSGELESLLGKPTDDVGNIHTFSEVKPALEHLLWISDSMADLALAESVHALVQGDYERASAIQNAAAFGDVPPPEVRSVITPNSGMTVTHRIVLIPQNAESEWKAPSLSVRRQYEPALESWVGMIVGDPAQVVYDVRDNATGMVERWSLADLPLAALDAVYLAPQAADGVGQSGLGKMIELDFQERHHGATDMTIEAAILVNDDEMSLVDFVLLANNLRQVLSGGRAASASDFALGEGEEMPVASVNELMRRAVRLNEAFAEAFAAVEGADSQLFDALLRLSFFNVPQAIPDADDYAGLTAQAAAVLTAVKVRRDDAQALLDKARENGANASPEQRIRTARAVFATILGREYPVMLRFQMPLPNEALSDQPAGVSDDPHVTAGWLLKMARVRPELAPLRGLMTTAEALHDQPLFAFRVAQVPTVAGEAWVGMARPNDEGSDRLSLVLTGNGDLTALSGEISGLVLDHWIERIPSNYEMTGLTFHFDAPTSRPPQSLLLAAPPEDTAWNFELVVGTVREAFALARIRTVEPDTLGEYGHHIPAVFLSQDLDMTGATSDVVL